jgi:hypothetical protein
VHRPPLRVENKRKILGEIGPRQGRIRVRKFAPVCDLFFMVEPWCELFAKSAESFYNPTTQAHTVNSFRLACFVDVAKKMAKQKSLKKMPDNRQEWIRQHGKGNSWTKRRFTDKARDLDLNRLFRMSSLVGAVTNDQ